MGLSDSFAAQKIMNLIFRKIITGKKIHHQASRHIQVLRCCRLPYRDNLSQYLTMQTPIELLECRGMHDKRNGIIATRLESNWISIATFCDIEIVEPLVNGTQAHGVEYINHASTSFGLGNANNSGK